MLRVYTEKEQKAILGAMEVQVDTREQVWDHVRDALEQLGCPMQRRALQQGDYTALVPLSAFGGLWTGLEGYTSLEDEVVIERKANLDELAGNLTADRRRLEAELIRAKAHGVKVFLLVENGSWEGIWSHDYRSRLSPKAFAATLLSWQVKYDVTVVFCQPEETGRILYGTLYYWLRARLEGEA